MTLISKTEQKLSISLDEYRVPSPEIWPKRSSGNLPILQSLGLFFPLKDQNSVTPTNEKLTVAKVLGLINISYPASLFWTPIDDSQLFSSLYSIEFPFPTRKCVGFGYLLCRLFYRTRVLELYSTPLLHHRYWKLFEIRDYIMEVPLGMTVASGFVNAQPLATTIPGVRQEGVRTASSVPWHFFIAYVVL